MDPRWRYKNAPRWPGQPPPAGGNGGRRGGASKTLRHRTPADLAGQTRLAARMLAEAARACPAHPLWAYASGRCLPSYAAREMERGVARALALAPALERAELAGLRLEP